MAKIENNTRDIKTEAPQKKQNEQKRYTPNILSRFFFCWMCPVLIKGNKNNVEETDLIAPSNSFDSSNQGEYLERYWFQELRSSSTNNRKPSLWRAIRKAYFWQFMPGAVLLTIHTVARTLLPIIFAELLSYWSAESTLTQLEAVYYALAMLGINFISMISFHHNTLFLGKFAMKLKISCTAILYRKLMRINQASVGDVAAGKLVNLMSNDIARFDYAFLFLHNIWMTPIQAGVVLYLLWESAGYAPFVGVFGFFVVAVPFQGLLTKLTATVRRKTATRTDKRIKLMNEIVNGIQVIKMCAWEKPFQFIVRTARKLEMASLRNSLFIRSILMGFMIFTERTILFLTTLTLVLSGTAVTATIIFPIQQYLNLIQINLTFVLPMGIAGLTELFVSLDRIQEFLLLDERADLELLPANIYNTVKPIAFKSKNKVDSEFVTAKKYIRNDESSPVGRDSEFSSSSRNSSEYMVELKNVSASWTNSEELTLKNLSLRIRKNELCAVIGPVGSGKSSLLQLLLKELPSSNGTLHVNGTLSYACQESWLFPATVRENILFGLSFNYKKYNEICRICCLLPDFKQFPYGDLSLVGERGVSLSGGQRARINLARAIYRDADVYLLDDPLSAVDANVGRLLFDECIRGYLRGRTCVLVTHQIHFLKVAEQLVVMNEGSIEGVGSYNELLSCGKKLVSMLSNIDHETKDCNETTVSKALTERGISRVSVISGGEPSDKEVEQILEAEERSTGALKWKIVKQYLKSTGSWFLVFVTAVFLITAQASATCVDYWLTFWTNQVDSYEQSLPDDQEFDSSIDAQIGLLTTKQYISIYGGIMLFIIVFAHLRIIFFVATTMRASEKIHDFVFQNLIRAIMRFFDTNPSGRILNRFSKDMGAMDELMPRSFLDAMQMYFLMTGILVLNAIALPWTLIPTFVLVLIFIFLLKWYVNTAQAVKRLEGTTKSPVFGIISSSISGLSTIRSADAQSRLINSFDSAQDLHSSAFYTFLGGTVAFSFFLDMLCLLYLGIVIAIFLVVDFGAASVGNVGLAVTQTMFLTFILQHTARFTTEFLAQFTSVERVLEYTKLPMETNIDDEGTTPPLEWPDKGHLKFRNVFLRYSIEEPPVLKNLNFEIQSGWKVGVVGRTGAGKSSLISALFRLSNIEGSVTIDGINTEDLNKQKMRSKVSIIPQEPVLFSATIRYNLDPFDLYSDDDIWRSLEQVELKDAIPGLDDKVSEGGSNFSVGQRQLLCLARAVLRSNKILVMDEATANVDPQTDALIQKTIRREFATCTVITIAHRLNTIMDSDRVMVMDKGELVEYDYPYILLNNPNSLFTFMVNETGEASARNLYDIAKIKYLSANPNK